MKFKKLSNGGGGSKAFLRLKSGERVKGIFKGDPFDFRQHWSQSEKRSYICTGDDCEHCKAGEKSSFRFRINVIVKENEAYTAKVWDQGRGAYETLSALHDGGYDLEKTVVTISRHGEGVDTTYSVLPVPGEMGQVNADLEKKLGDIQLHNLENPTDNESDDSDNPPF